MGRIGGNYGYFYADTLWRLRGLIDRFLGGRGLGPARQPRGGLRPGDTLDFWRVLQADPPRRLRLLSEMKVPGDAWLDFSLAPLGQIRCEIQLTARFLPKGLAGILYWYAFLPFHHLVFRGMLPAIARSAGRSLIHRPHRFTPEENDACFLPRYEGGDPA